MSASFGVITQFNGAFTFNKKNKKLINKKANFNFIAFLNLLAVTKLLQCK